MALMIPGAPLTVTLAASNINTTIYVDSVDYSPTTRGFQRKEFSNAYLMNLPEADGTEPIFVKNAVGLPVQINFNCGAYTARNVLPDDANLNNILKNMVINTYIIKGGPTPPSSIDNIYAIAADHKLRYDSFDAYLEVFNLKLSITEILSFQSFTFSYMLNTGFNLAGGELFTANNCLIKSFSEGIMFTDPISSAVFCKDWSMTIDQITSINSKWLYQT